ncbi:MAG: hypothetical protein P8Y40_02430 [Desulfobacterales bacterium]
MKPFTILILTFLPLLAGCYTTPGYYGGSYGYVPGPSYYLGFGYPYVYKNHDYRYGKFHPYKHPTHKGYSKRHRFHRPNVTPPYHFDRTIGKNRGHYHHRFKQRSFNRDRHRGSGHRFKRGHHSTRQNFKGHHRGNGRSFGRGTPFSRGFRR